MSRKNGDSSNRKRPPSVATNLIAGGSAGMMEALACHPLDTIKVRMQLSRRARAPGTKQPGFLRTGQEIIRRETPLGLYKGLGAVITGIVPKMAIRFTSYEWYKQKLANKSTGAVSGQATFFAGLGAGVTEAVAVVTPMEVVKIRLQAQHHSMADPLDIPKYRNAAHATYLVIQEEGFGALYRGVSLTALRQGSNQAVNFSAYAGLKSWLQRLQPEPAPTSTSTSSLSSLDRSPTPAAAPRPLPRWQTMLIGLVSGAMGPLSNAPIDTIKTRLQKTPTAAGETSRSRMASIVRDMWKQEGVHAFYKGITPRIMRVAPGQAVTFTVYETVRSWLEGRQGEEVLGGKFEE